MNDCFGQIVVPVIFLLFLAATVVQVLCWCIVFGGFAFAPSCFSVKEGSTSSGENPANFSHSLKLVPVSVVVCARNEAENLRRHIPLWLAQVYATDWELLIVDDASEDDTSTILQFFEAQNPRLQVLRLAEKTSPGKKAALARGIAAATYEHLVLTDADCAPVGPHWLAHMANALAEKPKTEIVLGYAPLSARSGLLNSWARFETAYTALQYFAFARIGMPYMGVGRNLAWKRALFQQAGGFVGHADLPSGDDDLLVNAVAQPGRVVLCLHPASFVYSDAKTTWTAWLRQKQRQLGSGLRYRWGHQIVLAAVAASQIFHYFFALVLLLVWYSPALVLAIWLLRLVLACTVWKRVFRRFQERNLLIWVPLLDVLLAIYYAVFVPLAFLRGKKGVNWK